ncbi:protein disulfide-isomerase-like [Bactrocera tryoni]|uniref:protein disulfide-isomerase-like n=1 Tax=Bactrocera tryoni TaxID=59916 RepID=UPI001A95AB82|nr:protein disulfide-isomerase-like [Bactrocera tryoni]
MIMKFLISSLLLLAVATTLAYVTEEEVPNEDGVLVLTTANFKRVIEANDFVLVDFYAPWCGASIALTPEFAKAAQFLAEWRSPIKLAKVDVTVSSELDTYFQLRQYPTMKYFRRGVPFEYNGGYRAADIIAWLNAVQ